VDAVSTIGVDTTAVVAVKGVEIEKVGFVVSSLEETGEAILAVSIVPG
jgi:hypothetical protein